jgi:hypothetical protein
VAAGHSFVDTAASKTARIEPRHRGRDTAFVQDRAPADRASSAGWRKIRCSGAISPMRVINSSRLRRLACVSRSAA